MPATLRMFLSSKIKMSSCSIVITTSPIPSHPSIDIINEVLFYIENDLYLKHCTLIIVFDGFQTWNKCEWKSSRVTEEAAMNYEQYKLNLKARLGFSRGNVQVSDLSFQVGTNTISHAKVERIKVGEEGKEIITISHSLRTGFALALKSGLIYITTDVTLIHQHDWLLNEGLPFKDLVGILKENKYQSGEENKAEDVINNDEDVINYIGFLSRKNLNYNQFKAGKLFQEEVRKSSTVMIEKGTTEGPLPFTRLFFYYDRPHLAKTSFLNNYLFGNCRFKRGDFIEDKFGHIVMNDCKENGLDGWRKYGLWIYYPDDGHTIAIRHLNGRKYMSYKPR